MAKRSNPTTNKISGRIALDAMGLGFSGRNGTLGPFLGWREANVRHAIAIRLCPWGDICD